MTNLTPAQLEQFETTFRYFDKDKTNTLNQFEMSAALASLGIVYPVSPAEGGRRKQLTVSCLQEEDLDIIYDELLQGYGAVTFEAFINLLVSTRTLSTRSNCWLSDAVGRHHGGSNDAGTTPGRVQGPSG